MANMGDISKEDKFIIQTWSCPQDCGIKMYKLIFVFQPSNQSIWIISFAGLFPLVILHTSKIMDEEYETALEKDKREIYETFRMVE